jgi:hypothetical protein
MPTNQAIEDRLITDNTCRDLPTLTVDKDFEHFAACLPVVLYLHK